MRKLRGLALLALCACSADGGAAPEPPCAALALGARPPGLSLILVVNDTMRRDYVGIHGGPAATPNFDAFAQAHLYFERARANAPWTKPSVSTLFTSTYPSQHGIADHPELRQRMFRDTSGSVIPEVDVLAEGYTTLAEMLQAAGYRTAAFVSNPWMGREFGYAQGFEVYDDSFARWEADGGALGRGALAWLYGLAPDERFFLYVHYVDTHQPYGSLTDDDIAGELPMIAGSMPATSRDGRQFFDWLIHHEQQRLAPETIAQLEQLGPSVRVIELAYRRGIEDFDRHLGTLLDGIARHAAAERTAIVVTSDHGEALYQRNYGSHGMGLYDDELAIPFAAKLPGVSVGEARIDCALELIDVLPTLAAYLEVPAPQHAFGRNLFGNGEPRYGVSEGVMFKPRNRTLRNAEYKLVWQPDGPVVAGGPEYALFNVVEDPAESRDLLAEVPPTVEARRVADSLKARIASAVPAFDAPAREFAPVDPAIEERLRSLGYVD